MKVFNIQFIVTYYKVGLLLAMSTLAIHLSAIMTLAMPRRLISSVYLLVN